MSNFIQVKIQIVGNLPIVGHRIPEFSHFLLTKAICLRMSAQDPIKQSRWGLVFLNMNYNDFGIKSLGKLYSNRVSMFRRLSKIRGQTIFFISQSVLQSLTLWNHSNKCHVNLILTEN
jgi:hypothetical protein